jgi:hypothetical protein
MRVHSSGGDRPSSFFPDQPLVDRRLTGLNGESNRGGGPNNGPTVTERMRTRNERQNAVEQIMQREALVQAARDLRLVAPFAPRECAPQWETANFVPSEHTRAAFEQSHDAEQLEIRAREGLGVSVRFPATRTALWHPEPQGLPVHITHDTCLPSVCLPPCTIASMRSFLCDADADRQQMQLEFVGQVTSVDHQLAFAHSLTRGKLQVVFDILRPRSKEFGGNGGLWRMPSENSDGYFTAALLQRQQDAADAEMLAADEQQAAVATVCGVLKQRRRFASAIGAATYVAYQYILAC